MTVWPEELLAIDVDWPEELLAIDVDKTGVRISWVLRSVKSNRDDRWLLQHTGGQVNGAEQCLDRWSLPVIYVIIPEAKGCALICALSVREQIA